MKSPASFGILPTIEGWDVIDNRTGRPVGHKPTAARANAMAFKLNGAAMAGPDALIAALGGREPRQKGATR